MPIITAQEINAIAFTEHIDLALIDDEILNAAERKFLISAITKPVYDDLSVHPGKYTILTADYIKPFLAYGTKFILYSQYYYKMNLTSITIQQRESILNETTVILDERKNLLINHLLSGLYPLFIAPSKKRISGFFSMFCHLRIFVPKIRSFVRIKKFIFRLSCLFPHSQLWAGRLPERFRGRGSCR